LRFFSAIDGIGVKLNNCYTTASHIVSEMHAVLSMFTLLWVNFSLHKWRLET